MDELIRAGLLGRQKSVPSALLYDDLGSALFEAITMLPEYEVSRTDTSMLGRHADTALGILGTPLEVIELGPGTGRKARLLLERLSVKQPSTRFFAIDTSPAALQSCARLVEELPAVQAITIEGMFIDGLRRLPPRRADARRLVLFLGSNLSNFDRRESLEFFRDVRRQLAPGDALLLSADLEKAPERLLPAYDDALGVTAAFNRNVLSRLNREWGADFDLSAFAHEVRWDAAARRIEMHLRALRQCEVHVPRLKLTLHFDVGETLWTESSHRFDVAELRSWGFESGLACTEAWVDSSWPLALALFIAT